MIKQNKCLDFVKQYIIGIHDSYNWKNLDIPTWIENTYVLDYWISGHLNIFIYCKGYIYQQQNIHQIKDFLYKNLTSHKVAGVQNGWKGHKY